jgi:hypothetical protein
MAWPSRLETIFLLGISFTRRARLPSFCDLNILVDLSADRVVHAFSISSIPIRLSALSSMSARTMKLKRTRYVCSPPVGPVRLSNQSSPADPPLRLSESQMRKTTGVDLSPELWLCKLCLGAIDSSYDSKDESHKQPQQQSSYGQPPQQYGQPPQQYGGQQQSYGGGGGGSYGGPPPMPGSRPY